MVALGRVVVDDVEDHLDPGPMQRLHEPLELPHLLALRAGGGVAGVRGEEADRRVAPVVRQAAVLKEVLVRDVVDRQQLDRRDAEIDEVGDRRLGGEARIGAAKIVPDARQLLREALHVELVDDGRVPGPPEQLRRPPSRTTASITTDFGIAAASSLSSMTRSSPSA